MRKREWKVGDKVGAGDYANLPVGTKVQEPGKAIMTKLDDDFWENTYDHFRDHSNTLFSERFIVELPAHYVQPADKAQLRWNLGDLVQGQDYTDLEIPIGTKVQAVNSRDTTILTKVSHGHWSNSIDDKLDVSEGLFSPREIIYLPPTNRPEPDFIQTDFLEARPKTEPDPVATEEYNIFD